MRIKASRAGISEKTQRRALEILNRAEQTRITAGKGPMGLAASARYIAGVLEQVTQGDIAEVTEVTIRNRSKDLRSTLGI